jgi:hypothetical protein
MISLMEIPDRKKKVAFRVQYPYILPFGSPAKKC